MTKKEMPLSATRNYTPIGVMVVGVVIIVPPKIVTYDKPAPTIVVATQIVDMLIRLPIIYHHCYGKYILNKFN